MRKHMLKYHVGIPLAVFAVLALVGVPLASALRYAIAAGCVSMVVMMVTGRGHHGHHGHRRPAHHPAHDEGGVTAPRS